MQSVRSQTALTHNNPAVIESAEFFAGVTWRVIHGETPIAAIKQVVDDGFPGNPIKNGSMTA